MFFKLENEIFNRGFLFANHQFYIIKPDGLHACTVQDIKKVRFPILIVGKEHCLETTKVYPITDKKDLVEVIKIDNNEFSIVEEPKISDRESLVKVWQIDNVATEIVSDKLMLWLPELWVFRHAKNRMLHDINRANNCLWMYVEQGSTYSSIAKGLLSKKNNFLMSIGVDTDVDVQTIDTKSYADFVASNIRLLSFNNIYKILPVQGYLNRIRTLFSWPSVFGGLFVGTLLFLLLHIMYLDLRVDAINEEIVGQKIATVIALQNSIEKKHQTLTSLETSLYSSGSSISDWELLATMMESGVTILRVNQKNGMIEVRAESELATDTLRLISELANVENVQFITPVRESLGKERYTIQVKWANGKMPNE